MAIKPTIYKLTVSLSDLNRQIYDSLSLTIARHPSETMERMAVRMLAFCRQVHRKQPEPPSLCCHTFPKGDPRSSFVDDQAESVVVSVAYRERFPSRESGYPVNVTQFPENWPAYSH